MDAGGCRTVAGSVGKKRRTMLSSVAKVRSFLSENGAGTLMRPMQGLLAQAVSLTMCLPWHNTGTGRGGSVVAWHPELKLGIAAMKVGLCPVGITNPCRELNEIVIAIARRHTQQSG